MTANKSINEMLRDINCQKDMYTRIHSIDDAHKKLSHLREIKA